MICKLLYLLEDLWGSFTADTGANITNWNAVYRPWTNTAVFWVVYWGVAAAALDFPEPIPGEQCEDMIIFDNLKVSCQALATLTHINWEENLKQETEFCYHINQSLNVKYIFSYRRIFEVSSCHEIIDVQITFFF